VSSNSLFVSLYRNDRGRAADSLQVPPTEPQHVLGRTDLAKPQGSCVATHQGSGAWGEARAVQCVLR
jgi:hypothetical protein